MALRLHSEIVVDGHKEGEDIEVGTYGASCCLQEAYTYRGYRMAEALRLVVAVDNLSEEALPELERV